MSESELINLLPALGEQLTGHLVEKRRSLTGQAAKPAKIAEARMDADDFKQIAQEVGQRPLEPGKDEEKGAQLGQLKFHNESLIDAEQAAHKRPLTPTEKRELMRREFDNKGTRRRVGPRSGQACGIALGGGF